MTFPSFSVGEVLTAADMNVVGLWKINTTTAAGTSTDVNFQSLLTSSYTNYLVVARNVSASAGQLRLILLNGATPITTNYYGAMALAPWTGALSAQLQVNNGAHYGLGFTNGASFPLGFVVNIYQPQLAARTSFSHTGQCFWDGAANGGGYHDAATSYNGFRIFHQSANVTGTFDVYGYRN